MDCGDKMILFIGKVVSSFFCERVGIERMWICFWLWHKPIPDVWSLTAELHRRKLNRFARTRKRRQWAAAQLCGQSFTFHRVTINLVLKYHYPWYLRRALICGKAILCQWESFETTQRIEHCSPGDITCGLTLLNFDKIDNNPISAF